MIQRLPFVTQPTNEDGATRTKRLIKVLALTVTTLAMLTSTASAAVQFDPATGTGFAPKGDVQSAFGWNNADLQANADGLTFSVSAKIRYQATCVYTSGKLAGTSWTQYRNSRLRGGVIDVVDRENPQGDVTGFILNGYASDASETFGASDDPNGAHWPAVGNQCWAAGKYYPAVYTSVVRIGALPGGTNFYVNFGATSVLLATV